MKYKIGIIAEVEVPSNFDMAAEDDFFTHCGKNMLSALHYCGVKVNRNWLLSYISDDEPDYDNCSDFIKCEPIEWKE